MRNPLRPDDTAAHGDSPDGVEVAREPGEVAQEAAGPTPVVDFYWRPGCPFCMMLKRAVKKRNLPVEYHNIWDDPYAAATVRAAAGGSETVPTVGIAGHMLVNPPVRLVEEILAKVASGELAPRT